MAVQAIQEKRDTAANWTSANPVLLPAQFGVETDTGRVKCGVAAGTAWNALAYLGGAGVLTSLPIREPFASNAVSPNAATLLNFGAAVTAIDSSVATARPTAATDRYSRKVRNAYVGPTAAVDRMAGWTIAAAAGCTRAPTAAIPYGWRYRIAAAVGDPNANGQFAIGLAAALPAFTSSVQPSAMQNCVFMGADSTDANMQIMRNGVLGACIKLDLGSGFPANTNATRAYEFTIEFRSNGTTRTFTWTARNLITDEVVGPATQADNTALPVAGTAMGEMCIRGSAAVAGAPVIEFFGKQVGVMA